MNSRGFTLVELLLTIALVGLVAGVTLPLSRTFFVRNNLNTAAVHARATLQRAQTLARNGAYDSDWGVRIEAGAITLFQGGSYAARDQAFDETTKISDALTVSGDTEIVFSRIITPPGSDQTVVIADDLGKQVTLAVNTYGSIE